MGLDNGIVCRENHLNKNDEFLKEFRFYYSRDFELCYWRKCWNVRNLILRALPNNEDNPCVYPLDLQNILVIIEILKHFNKDNWTSYGGSIWGWDDEDDFKFCDEIKKQIQILEELAKRMSTAPRGYFDLYFYDSY